VVDNYIVITVKYKLQFNISSELLHGNVYMTRIPALSRFDPLAKNAGEIEDFFNGEFLRNAHLKRIDALFSDIKCQIDTDIINKKCFLMTRKDPPFVLSYINFEHESTLYLSIVTDSLELNMTQLYIYGAVRLFIELILTPIISQRYMIINIISLSNNIVVTEIFKDQFLNDKERYVTYNLSSYDKIVYTIEDNAFQLNG